MTKQKKPEAKLVTVSKCARMLTESGTKISRQGLRKYVEEHSLISEIRSNGWVMVDFDVVQSRREDFTREVMRGEHSTTAPSKSKNKTTSASASKKAAPSLALVKDGDILAPSSLDKARDAKTRKENAQAEAAEIDLAIKKNELVPTADVEVGIAASNLALRDTLLGPLLSDTSDQLLAALGLPDEKKRPVQQIIRAAMISGLTKFGEACETTLHSLDVKNSEAATSRLDILIAEAARLRDLTPTAFKKETANA